MFSTLDGHLDAKRNVLDAEWRTTLPVSITVQRNKVYHQGIGAFEDFDEKDWGKKFIVMFAEECGVDAGGLTREFITLFFQQCSLLQGGTLIYDGNLVETDTYRILGRLTARAILIGHPGIGLFSNTVANFLLRNEVTVKDLTPENVLDVDARQAILDVSNGFPSRRGHHLLYF